MLFSRGKTEDKLRIIFDMCDNDRNGVIDKGELSEMLRSLVEIARTTSLSDEHVTELIEGMFQDAGLQQKDFLTYSDFKLMMKEYKGDFVAIGLDCKGAKQNFLDTSTNVARYGDENIFKNKNDSNTVVVTLTKKKIKPVNCYCIVSIEALFSHNLIINTYYHRLSKH